jgi:predicted chitinase
MSNIAFNNAQLNTFIPGSNFWTWRDALFSHPNYTDKNSSATIPLEHYNNIITLFDQIVRPLDQQFPGKFTINSCYRGQLNGSQVGGGQHGLGQGIDISPRMKGFSGKTVFNFIKDNLPYDQLIWETNNNFGTPPNDGEPNWIHISHKPGGPQRKMVMHFHNHKNQNFKGFGNSGTTTTGDGQGAKNSVDKNQFPKTTTTDTQGNSITSESVQDLSATFDQIDRNIANQEMSDVNVTWGMRANPNEDSDWIGLKQFLLYLCSRYTPQSLFPFVELVPILYLEEGINVGDEAPLEQRDGNTPKDVEQNAKNGSGESSWKKELQQQVDKFKSEIPPGYSKSRFDTGAKAVNDVSGISDLLSLDPFKEGINFMGELSPSGEIVRAQRNMGVRVYGQVVLNPGAIDGVPSKPGAIGFRSLEVNAGSQEDNGLAMIKMQLLDVQGNKFVDINSPWGFIYDIRPGSIGGDFWFRYGWQIRVPDPKDKSDLSSSRFWNHEGWKVFGRAKEEIMAQIIPGKQVITLTQALNVEYGIDERTEVEKARGLEDSKHLGLFDEGVVFNESNGTVTVSRTNLNESNYVKLSLLNPEIDVNEDSSIVANLSFRTTGAIVQSVPVAYAKTTKGIVTSQKGNILLGDLLLAIVNDSDKFGFVAIRSNEERKKAYDASDNRVNAMRTSRNFEGFAYVLGPDKGGNSGSLHPDDIPIKVSSKHMKALTTTSKDGDVTLIRWFRQVLQDNECELLSAATGSGAGINSSWIITTTKSLNDPKMQDAIKQRQVREARTRSESLASTIIGEKDVFSYRFMGSLVEKLKVEKTEANNAMKINADFAVGDLSNFDATAPDAPDQVTRPLTAADRKRNLMVVFSQMQNVNIDALAHPWLGPGKKFFVKGMGFFDGEYLCLQVTHRLDHHTFTSNIVGARILVQNEGTSDDIGRKTIASSSGKGNFTTSVTTQESNDIADRQGVKALPGTPGSSEVVTALKNAMIKVTKNKKGVDLHYEGIVEVLRKYDIKSKIRIAHFLAQVFHESGNLVYTKEIASGQAYEGRQDLGNTQPGDGVRYKGRGLVQITGRSNYTSISSDTSVAFIQQPLLLEHEKYAASSAGWFWSKKNLNKFADITTATITVSNVVGSNVQNQNSLKAKMIKAGITGETLDAVQAISYLINGGFNGLQHRKQLFKELVLEIPGKLNDVLIT